MDGINEITPAELLTLQDEFEETMPMKVHLSLDRAAATIERLTIQVDELNATLRLANKNTNRRGKERDSLRGKLAMCRKAFEKLRGYGRSDMGHQQLCDYVTETATETLETIRTP